MPIAKLKSLDISYADEGEGDAILLIHGFASTKEANWIDTGWVKLLVDSGYRVIAFDNRGHGDSTKFHDSSDYSLDIMAEDTLALLNHLDIRRCHLMGYSMGARISARLSIEHGERFDRVILAGNGDGMINGTGDWNAVRDALLAPGLDDVTDLRGRAFRKFADATRSDLMALAACVTAVRQLFRPEEFAGITNKVLVAIGSKDDIAGSGEVIADLVPDGRFLSIPGRDHMRAVGDKVYMQGVLDFLGE